MKQQLTVHPACAAYPDLEAAELQELADSIEEHGQLEPCWVYHNQLIDGKNRQRACELKKIKPNFEQWYPTDPGDEERTQKEIWQFTKSKNLDRRQLTASQRAMAVATFNAAILQYCKVGQTQPQMAAEAAVSPRLVADAVVVVDKGSESVKDAVRSGEVTVSDARKVVNEPVQSQDNAVEAVRAGERRTLAGKPPKTEKPPAASKTKVSKTGGDGEAAKAQRARMPRKVDNGDLGAFDAAAQKKWRDAYGVLHRMVGEMKAKNPDGHARVDEALGEFYDRWSEFNKGKWS